MWRCSAPGSGKRYLLAHEVNRPKKDVARGVRLGESSRGKVIWEESTFNPNGGPCRDSVRGGRTGVTGQACDRGRFKSHKGRRACQ